MSNREVGTAIRPNSDRMKPRKKVVLDWRSGGVIKREEFEGIMTRGGIDVSRGA
jgi:hypothetical protein